MKERYTTLGIIANTIVDTLDAAGLDGTEMLRDAGLDVAALRAPGGRYPASKMQEVFARAVAETEDSAFGLRIVDHVRPTSMHALGFAWYSSGSLGAALDRLDRYHRMLSTALDWTTEVDTETRRLKVVVAPGLDLRDEVIDAAFAWIVLQCRQLCGDDFSPRRVEMTRPTPEPVQPFLDYFRTQIDFGTDENILHFNIEGLSDPLVSANEELAAECDAIVERYLARFDREDYALQVRVKISELLPSGAVSEGAVAKSLHVSLRNLQRKLSAQDTKYKDILDETRHTLALQYLGHSSFSVTETAFLLGFENPSNFTRAFKRWTGSTPTQHINYPG